MRTLAEVIARSIRAANQGTFNYGVHVVPKGTEEGPHVLDLKCTTEQKIRVVCTPVTGAGNPAELDGPVTFTVESGTGTVEMNGDTSAWLIAGDTPGDTVYMVVADADLGEGVEQIADTIRLTVEGAKAASLGLTADAPVNK